MRNFRKKRKNLWKKSGPNMKHIEMWHDFEQFDGVLKKKRKEKKTHILEHFHPAIWV